MNHGGDPSLSRRGFLQGVAAVGVGAMAADVLGEAQAAGGGKLPTNPFGKTGLKVTRISYGALNTQGGPRGGQVLKMAVEAGVNTVHVSTQYTKGNAIRAVGETFAKNPGMRDKLTLCLKGAPENARQLNTELDEMLKILSTDHCDVYLPVLHQPDKGHLDETMKVMDDLKKAGKIRFKGFVCHGGLNEVIEMVLDVAPDHFDAALLSTEMVLAAKNATGPAKEKAERFVQNLGKLHKQGVGVISMKSKAREAMQAGPEVFQAHCKSLLAGGCDTVLFTFASIQQVDTIKQIDLVTAMTPREEHLAREFQISRGPSCLMCSECTRHCPQKLPVNDLMRIRMYHDIYGDIEHARATYRDLGGNLTELASKCGPCTECRRVCPMGIACAERVKYVTSLFS